MGFLIIMAIMVILGFCFRMAGIVDQKEEGNLMCEICMKCIHKEVCIRFPEGNGACKHFINEDFVKYKIDSKGVE